MKIIDTNKLNRFWKNGVKPIADSVAKKLDTSKVINNLLTTKAGYALDARQGKVLQDQVSEINSNLSELNTGLTAKKSTISFQDASGENIANSMGSTLDIMHAKISTYPNGISDFSITNTNVFFIHSTFPTDISKQSLYKCRLRAYPIGHFTFYAGCDIC